MSKTNQADTGSTPKKKRGRPAGYRKSPDGTWYKLEEDNLLPKVETTAEGPVEEHEVKKTRKPKKIKIKVKDNLDNESFDDDAQPSDEELDALEKESYDDDVSSSMIEDDTIKNIIDQALIRPIAWHPDRYTRIINYKSEFRPPLYADRIALKTVIVKGKCDYIRFSSFETYLEDICNVAKANVPNVVASILMNEHMDSYNDFPYGSGRRAFAFYFKDNPYQLIDAILIKANSLDEALNLITSSDVAQYHLPDGFLGADKSDCNLYAIYYQPSDQLEYKKEYYLGYQGLISTEFDATGCKFDGIAFNVSGNDGDGPIFTPAWLSKLTFAKFASVNTYTDNDYHPLDEGTEDGEVEDIDEDSLDDSDDEEDDRYLVDRKSDGDTEDMYDHLIAKANKEMNKGKLLSYDQIYYPGSSKDRREFESLDNGNYRHRKSGLSDEWNPDEF